jgi:hypothetical protein
MGAAAVDFGAGRGSGTASDGRGVASPGKAPAEPHAASVKPPKRIATNPPNRPDIVPSHSAVEPET